LRILSPLELALEKEHKEPVLFLLEKEIAVSVSEIEMTRKTFLRFLEQPQKSFLINASLDDKIVAAWEA
jgi:hypothetical protein